jgi:hypothetical protein
MKFRGIIFSILLLLLIIGTASAENCTDTLEIDDAADNDVVEVDSVDVESQTDEPLEEVSSTGVNVTFDEVMWEENLSDISVDVPQDTEGSFAVKINDEVIYNQTITNRSFKVPIKLPKPLYEFVISVYPPVDYRTYQVSAFLNGADLNINKTLTVMKFSPEVSYLHFPEEILQYGRPYSFLAFPRSANGTVEFYIDGRLFNRSQARPTFYWNDNPFSKLPLGNHTLTVVYYGDRYYHPFNTTFEFLVTNVVISIPSTINVGHDDCISVDTLENVTGTVSVYLDNVLVHSSKTDEGNFFLSLEEYLKVNTREVKVVYTSKHFTRTKIAKVNVTYDIDVYSSPMTYGEENIIEIIMPDTMNRKLLTVTVNGTKFSFKHPSNSGNNLVEVNVSKLRAGNYTMVVSFPGDSRFEAKTVIYNFTIDYAIMGTYDVIYKDSSKVYLNLPKDAKGNLEVYIDGKLLKSVKVVKGYAEIRIDSIKPGMHNLYASYTGSDYSVVKVDNSVYVSPKVVVTYRFTAGEDKYVAVKVPKDCKGYVIFEIDYKPHKVAIKNGVAKYSLKNLKAGEHDINVAYYGADGFNDTYNWRVVTVYKPKVKIVSCELSFKSAKVKIKILNKKSKPMAKKKVTVILNGKKYTVKTNKKGIAVLEKKVSLKAKKSKVKVKLNGAKASKKAKVKKIFLKVSKRSGKVMIKADVKTPAKSRTVTFTVNGQKITAKASKKGAVKLSVKKPKKSKVKVAATYLGDTVKQTLKL